MDSNINLDKLWARQTTQPLETEELFSKFSEIKRKGLKKLITFNIIMIVTIIYIIFIWLYFEPKLITTKVGIGLTLFGIVVYLIVYNQLIPNLIKTNENQSNNEFLKAVIKLKKRHRFLQTRMLQIYFIALTIGISLYLYEYVSLLPLPWAIVAYSVTLIWVGFNWFFLKPKVIKMERNKYDDIINRFENLGSQIK